jgi:GNAT superfamily N-acetyltransferase
MSRTDLRRSIESFVDGYLHARAQASIANVAHASWGLTVRYGPGMGRPIEHFVAEAQDGFDATLLRDGDWLTLFGEQALPAAPAGLVAQPRASEFFMASDLDVLSRRLDEAEGRFAVAPAYEPATPGACVFRHAAEGRTIASVCCALGRGDDVVVDRLATDPAWRGRGLARNVLRAATDWARARGRRRMRLIASLDGYRLYRKLGFETVAPVRVLALEGRSQRS